MGFALKGFSLNAGQNALPQSFGDRCPVLVIEIPPSHGGEAASGALPSQGLSSNVPGMWPIDKLSIIQDACKITGDNAPSVADDGSEEWDIGSTAYEMALPYAIEGANWKFGTIVAPLTALPGTPSDPAFDAAYGKPADLLHLIWVKLSDVPVAYQVLDNQIVMSNAGRSPVTAKYVRAPSIDKVTPTFAMALRAFVMSGIYRGLHENIGEADKMWAFGEKLLHDAATRSDQEQGKRVLINSRVTAARFQRVGRAPAGWGR